MSTTSSSSTAASGCEPPGDLSSSPDSSPDQRPASYGSSPAPTPLPYVSLPAQQHSSLNSIPSQQPLPGGSSPSQEPSSSDAFVASFNQAVRFQWQLEPAFRVCEHGKQIWQPLQSVMADLAQYCLAPGALEVWNTRGKALEDTTLRVTSAADCKMGGNYGRFLLYPNGKRPTYYGKADRDISQRHREFYAAKRRGKVHRFYAACLAMPSIAPIDIVIFGIPEPQQVISFLQDHPSVPQDVVQHLLSFTEDMRRNTLASVFEAAGIARFCSVDEGLYQKMWKDFFKEPLPEVLPCNRETGANGNWASISGRQTISSSTAMEVDEVTGDASINRGLAGSLVITQGQATLRGQKGSSTTFALAGPITDLPQLNSTTTFRDALLSAVLHKWVQDGAPLATLITGRAARRGPTPSKSSEYTIIYFGGKYFPLCVALRDDLKMYEIGDYVYNMRLSRQAGWRPFGANFDIEGIAIQIQVKGESGQDWSQWCNFYTTGSSGEKVWVELHRKVAAAVAEANLPACDADAFPAPEKDHRGSKDSLPAASVDFSSAASYILRAIQTGNSYASLKWARSGQPYIRCPVLNLQRSSTIHNPPKHELPKALVPADAFPSDGHKGRSYNLFIRIQLAADSNLDDEITGAWVAEDSPIPGPETFKSMELLSMSWPPINQLRNHIATMCGIELKEGYVSQKERYAEYDRVQLSLTGSLRSKDYALWMFGSVAAARNGDSSTSRCWWWDIEDRKLKCRVVGAIEEPWQVVENKLIVSELEKTTEEIYGMDMEAVVAALGKKREDLLEQIKAEVPLN